MTLTHQPELEMSIIIPLHNEEENIPELYRRLTDSLKQITRTYEIILVNDGSLDKTEVMLNELALLDNRVKVLHLTRNFGHQAAISAGLSKSRGNATVIMDGDLQDPPESLNTFLSAWKEGYEVVYAIREKRKEGILKRTCYYLFYRLLRILSDIEIPLDSGDFCLMDRKVVKEINRLPEHLRFVRGLRSFVGFKQVGIRYERQARAAGDPKYTFRQLMSLAVNGLVSFSSYPLRLALYLGILCSFLCAALACWVLYVTYFGLDAPRGWASAMIVSLFLGAMQLMCIGIMGEYVRCIFIETKGRPLFIIREQRNGTC